jgi:hypothetical protein
MKNGFMTQPPQIASGRRPSRGPCLTCLSASRRERERRRCLAQSNAVMTDLAGGSCRSTGSALGPMYQNHNVSTGLVKSGQLFRMTHQWPYSGGRTPTAGLHLLPALSLTPGPQPGRERRWRTALMRGGPWRRRAPHGAAPGYGKSAPSYGDRPDSEPLPNPWPAGIATVYPSSVR